MCSFRTWVELEENVYVLQCTDCSVFQVRLHHSAFLFDPFSYANFRDIVIQKWKSVERDDQEDPIIIPTFNRGMDLLLNADQLAALYHLLDAADTEIKAAQMSSLFYQPH